MNIEDRLARFLNNKPQVSEAAFIAHNACIIGDVRLGPDSSVFYGATLRADIETIQIGEATNVQDGCIIHLADDLGVKIGAHCTIGHAAIVHACTVENEVLVGMGAILLDGCHIGPRSIIAAGALVPKGMIVPEGSLVVGTPGRIIRSLTEDERAANLKLAAKYVEVSRRFTAAGYHSGPLTPVSAP